MIKNKDKAVPAGAGRENRKKQKERKKMKKDKKVSPGKERKAPSPAKKSAGQRPKG